MKIGVVIPTYRGERWIRGCLDSLRTACTLPTEIIVVDNASDDQTPAIITQEFPEVTLIRNSANRGFAAAINCGLRVTVSRGCDFGVILNQDMLVPADWLLTLINNSQVDQPAVFSALELTYEGTGMEPAVRKNLFDQAPTLFDDILLRDLKDRYRVFTAYGGCLAIHRDVLKQVGFFDENFFLYCEDIDYCRRATRLGIAVWLLPQWRVRHKSSMTTQGGYSDPGINRHNRRGWIMLALKDPVRPYWQSYLATVKNTMKSLVAGALRLNPNTTRETISDLVWLFLNRRSILSARMRDSKIINAWPPL
ncbi:MAG: glycosyltransferase family 2 protein [Chromatiaceae bacterium]